MNCVKKYVLKICLYHKRYQGNLAQYNLATGQFDTGQFGTKSIWHYDNIAPGQFGTRTNWHQENLAPGQFFTRHFGTMTI